MIDNDLIYITGHQHPDTDSVVSAISYSFFKRAMGYKAVPCRLGPLNTETKYLLDRFGFEEPMLLEDARKKLSEISIDSPDAVTKETTVLETIHKMGEIKRNSIAIVDDENHVIGMISKSDLANIGLGDTASEIELLRQTPVSDIVKSIDGTLIYDDPETHINGKTSIVAQAETGIDKYEIKDRIVIVGNQPKAQEQLIRNGAGLLIVVWCDEVQPNVIEAAKEFHCPIIKSGHGTMNTSRYIFLAPPVGLVMTKNPLTLKDSILVDDASQQLLRTRYRSYPIVNDNDELVGYISRYHILNYKAKKIILVDHNEFAQSVKAVEKAQILEVIDHHRINDFKTNQPVSFRNEIVGSTATIVATMYRENQIPIPKELAGLLLGAVLSDTLVLESPTTTQKDKDIVNILAALADLDYMEFAKEMFTATTENANQSIHDMIRQDIKFYNLNNTRTMIAQVIVPSAKAMNEKSEEIEAEMEALVKKKDLDLLVVAFTSAIEKGSIFFAAGDKASRCTETFPVDKDGNHELIEGMLSRKGQILPVVTEALI